MLPCRSDDCSGPVDLYGLALTTTDGAARHYRAGSAQLFAANGRDALTAFEHATDSDAAFALGHAAVALTMRAHGEDGREAASRARHLVRHAATRRERQHVDALAAVFDGDVDRTVALGHEHLYEFPLDLLVFLVLVACRPTDRSSLAKRIAPSYGADLAFRGIADGRITLDLHGGFDRRPPTSQRRST